MALLLLPPPQESTPCTTNPPVHCLDTPCRLAREIPHTHVHGASVTGAAAAVPRSTESPQYLALHR
ncbi:hypothetical protein J6590_061111 [Homalodisca vitripennis]|nr:hypothetical protein J6590_061111 [Homalodisca vitripennis]